MGFLSNILPKQSSRLTKLPSGAFSVDQDGHIVSSTLPKTFPESQMREIGQRVLAFFRGSQNAQLPVTELNVYYPSLKLTARNLRGGAIVYLSPQALATTRTEQI
jgi:hypothetical protein